MGHARAVPSEVARQGARAAGRAADGDVFRGRPQSGSCAGAPARDGRRTDGAVGSPAEEPGQAARSPGPAALPAPPWRKADMADFSASAVSLSPSAA